MRRTFLVVLDLDPVIYKVSSLLSVGNTPQSVNHNGLPITFELHMGAAHRQSPHILICKQSEYSPDAIA
jgi:hypothetical protein